MLVRSLHATGPLAFSPDGRLLAVLSEPNGATVLDVETGSKRVTLFIIPPANPEQKGVDWLATTPDGYYTGSPRADRYVRWRLGDNTFPAERFAGEFKRPERGRAALETK